MCGKKEQYLSGSRNKNDLVAPAVLSRTCLQRMPPESTR